MEGIKSILKKLKWESVTMALVAIVVGIVFVAAPSASAKVLCYVAGTMLIIAGVLCFVRFFTARLALPGFMVYGIMLMLAGIFCCVRPDIVAGIITVGFGAYLVLDGAFKLRDGIQYTAKGIRGGWIMFLLSAVTVVLGIVVMFGTFDSVVTLAGISLIVDGVVDLATAAYFGIYARKAKKAAKKAFERANLEDISDVLDSSDE